MLSTRLIPEPYGGVTVTRIFVRTFRVCPGVCRAACIRPRDNRRLDSWKICLKRKLRSRHSRYNLARRSVTNRASAALWKHNGKNRTRRSRDGVAARKFSYRVTPVVFETFSSISRPSRCPRLSTIIDGRRWWKKKQRGVLAGFAERQTHRQRVGGGLFLFFTINAGRPIGFPVEYRLNVSRFRVYRI